MTTNSTFKLTSVRRDALAQVAAHTCVFEREVMTPGVAKALVSAGLVDKSPGRHGRLSTIQITEAGRALMAGVPCPCIRCKVKRENSARRGAP